MANPSDNRLASHLWHHKIAPPDLRVNLVARPRLLRMLDEGQKGRLTLLYAPAGYGKTTLLAQWREDQRAHGQAVAWLSFEEEDQDPTELLHHLALSVSRSVSGFRPLAPGNTVRPDGNETRRLLGEIVAMLGDCGQTTLILDDYHLARTQQIHQLVMQLVRSAPDHVHIVIASRFRGTFPISALKARGHVQEIGPQYLTFTPEEAAVVFGNAIAPESLQLLLERSEGWPVAIQLARNWIEGRARADDLIREFSGSAGDVALYLTEQIMGGLPERVQDFLLHTAIADQLNGDLADAICDSHDGWRMLETLKPFSAMLVPINGNSGWFRYHQLLLDYLRESQKSLGEAVLRQLHSRAAQWFAAHGQLEAAVRHASLASDYRLAAKMVEDAGGIWICIRHGAPHLKRLLHAVPIAEIDARPRLRIARGFLALKEGRLVDARRELQEARQQAATTASSDPDFAKDALALWAGVAEQGDDGLTLEDVTALDALLGDTVRTDRWLQGAVNELLCIAHIRRGNAILAEAAGREALRIYEEFQALNGRIFARINLSLATLLRGQLRESDELLTNAERLTKEFMPTDNTAAAIVRTLRAQVLYERGHLDAAWEACSAALSALESGESWFEVFDTGYGVAVRILVARADFNAALEIIERGQSIAQRRGLKRLENLLRYRRIEILTHWKQPGKLTVDLDALLDELHSSDSDLTFLEHEIATLTVARLAIWRECETAAVDLLQPLLVACQERGRMRPLIKALVLQGLAHDRLGKADEAVASIVRALSLAAPECWARSFIEEGEPVATLLDEVLRRIHVAALPSGTVSLVATVLSSNLDRAAGHSGSPSGLLKPREQEVLAGIAQGLSNKMIGRGLQLTDEAVKYHLKKLYAKLGVSDRDIAVAVARKYGILP